MTKPSTNTKSDKTNWTLIAGGTAAAAVVVAGAVYLYRSWNAPVKPAPRKSSVIDNDKIITELRNIRENKAAKGKPDSTQKHIDAYLSNISSQYPQSIGSSHPTLDRVNVIFLRADKDHDGVVSKAELKDYLKSIAHDFLLVHKPKDRALLEVKDLDARVEEAFKEFDKDADGKLNREEFGEYAKNFITHTFPELQHQVESKKSLDLYFHKYFLSDKSRTLNQTRVLNQVKAMFDLADQDGDGRVSKKELKTYFVKIAKEFSHLSKRALSPFSSPAVSVQSSPAKVVPASENKSPEKSGVLLGASNDDALVPQEVIEENFKEFDLDSDGYLNRKEFEDCARRFLSKIFVAPAVRKA